MISVDAIAPAALGLPVKNQLSKNVSMLPKARQLAALTKERPWVSWPLNSNIGYFSGIMERMICSAASAAVISTVLTRISGFAGAS